MSRTLPTIQLDLDTVQAFIDTRDGPAGVTYVLVIRDDSAAVEFLVATPLAEADRQGAGRIQAAVYTLRTLP